jgi:tetratricopeptide (TPR) repeat protein
MSHHSGRHADALKAYQKARRLALNDPVARAGMDRMLIDVYMYLARYTDARRAATRALSVYDRHGLKADWHKTRVNFANILHRLDRHEDASRIYNEATRFFQEAGDDLSAARCQYNLGNTLVQLFEIEQAETAYRSARVVYERLGRDLDATDVRYGQAWLQMLQGDLHVAMSELDVCRRTYAQAGNRRGEALCVLDLAEVCLGLGLNTEALAAARKAERLFAKLRLRYERAKAALFRAQSAVTLGQKREATLAAHRASSGFRSEKNKGFSAVAQLVFADLAGSRQEMYARRVVRAQGLFAQSQLPLWQAVCDLRLVPQSSHSHQALDRLAENKAAQVVPHLYASWQTALGDRYHTLGQGERAITCWTRAADRLDAVRSQLPPVELRASFTRKVPSPHSRLVETEAARNPRRAAIWSERLKTAGIWAPVPATVLALPERRRVTQGLDSLASQVAFLMHKVPGFHGERGLTVPSTQKALRKLQQEIRLGFSRVEALTEKRHGSAEDIDRIIDVTSTRLPIVQFHVAEEDILAFVHQNRKTTVCRFRGGRARIESTLERWRFFLERELFSTFPGRKIQAASEQVLWRELGDWLWKPLGVDPSADSVLIVGEGDLANLPWQALDIDGQLLCLRHHIILAPSIRHFVAAGSVRVTSPAVMVFRGDGANLPHVDMELQELLKRAGDCSVAFSPSRREDWPVEGESRVWHFSGHAVLRNENPFYSYLMMSDGPLFAADFRLRHCRVGLATLAACRTGEQVSFPGEESTGLVRSLLEMGTRNVVAGRWPVSDESAAEWMTHFYGRYFDSVDLFAAAREATLNVREKFSSAFHWAAFSVFGAGRTGGPHEGNK